MKRASSLLLVLATVVLGACLLSGGATAKGGAMATRYLISSTHTPEECLADLDKFSAAGKAALARFDFGCEAGDHTGYTIVTASSEQEALKAVPEPLRGKAKATKLHRFTADEIRSFHQHDAHK
ncbi:MAG: hypothetical protein HZB25_09675 [Candidatus Eisenbacteria bacterium]|nr:hypothetical protein [Candidatus Eisenbacteria bacterium]